MSQPVISIEMVLSPTIEIGVPCNLTISATLSSTYPTPITIYTWPTVFNINFALSRKNFICFDLSNNDSPVKLEITKGGKRSGFISRKLGSYHDQYWHTLEPGQKVDFTVPFSLATRERTPLLPAHRYRLGINERECVNEWARGTREEVLSGPEEDEPPHDRSGGRIELILPDPIEFEVVGSEDTGTYRQ